MTSTAQEFGFCLFFLVSFWTCALFLWAALFSLTLFFCCADWISGVCWQQSVQLTLTLSIPIIRCSLWVISTTVDWTVLCHHCTSMWTFPWGSTTSWIHVTGTFPMPSLCRRILHSATLTTTLLSCFRITKDGTETRQAGWRMQLHSCRDLLLVRTGIFFKETWSTEF